MIDRDQLRQIIRDEAQSFLVDDGRTIEHPDACARTLADRVLARIPRDEAVRTASLAETVQPLMNMLARTIPYLQAAAALSQGENARAMREIVDDARTAIQVARRDLATSEVTR